ncbi:site-specific integrase [Acidisphaera sp. S103]|uniref:site-specific integrase n=1 Tax=Acidisphaera sp. S103 TaxID=1747223 RepID=UPI00131CE5E0|nr:site-specific integrase [Acidisphaera sp. S103]
MANPFSEARKRQIARLDGVKPPTARAALAIAKSQAYQDAADAPATLRAYATDLANFEAWCGRHGFTPMPATPEIVGAYLAAAGEGYAMPTLRRRVAAIARACGVAGHPLDTKHPAIRETLRGIGRKHGAPARRSAALTTAEMRKLSRACGTDLAGARDRALLLIGFAGALRRSELVGLDMEQTTWTGDGLKLLIERSKTDKAGEGAEIAIPRGRSEETCPVTALQTWLTTAEITAGPLFRKVNRGGMVEAARLSPDAVRQILLKRAARAGLKGTLFEPISPHGLRAGFVTTAYRNGVPDEEIMGHTRHRSLTTMRSYVRRAKLGQTSPAGKLGL